MITLLDTRLGRILQWTVGAVLLAALALAVGRVMPTNPGFGVVAALLVLGLGLAAHEPAAIPLLAMPPLLVVYRVGAGGFNLSVSDVILFGATLVALVFTVRPFSPPLRTLLWLSALYQFATLFTVVTNPYLANAVEWVHTWMLVSGALIVGWTIGRAGFARLGLTLILLTASALAILTIVHGALQYAQQDFSPVYLSWPYGMHKNFVGTILGFGAAAAYARPTWMGWSRGCSLVAFWLMATALLLTQSRQGIVALGVAVFFVALRGDASPRKRSKLIVLFVVPALVLVGTLVKDQVESGNEFNSVFQRLDWFEETLGFWRESPWVGHGLRYWYQPDTPGFQPPNAELEVLASAGVIGLAAFLILMGGALVVLWRLNPVFGTLAFAMLLSRLVQSQLDLFWVAAQVSVPFVIVGIALGAEAANRENARLGLAREPRQLMVATH